RSAQEAFYTKVREDVERYQFIALELLASQPDLIQRIFDFQIKTKTILFHPKEKINQRILNGNDQELRTAFYDWQEEKILLANYYRMGIKRLEENNIKLDEIEKSTHRLESVIISKMEEFSTVVPNTHSTWADIQQSLKKEDLLVQIIKVREFKSQSNQDGIIFGFTNDVKYLAIFLSQDKDPFYVVINDELKTDAQLYASYQSFLKGSDDKNRSFAQLWEPIHQYATNTKDVKVIPDGIYCKINPNSFLVAADEYVIDNYYVSYLTSSKDVMRIPRNSLTRKVILFGNPDYKFDAENNNLGITSIPGAELEIASISSILKPQNWDTKTYSRQDATELRLRSSYNPTILHIATHGFFEDNEEFTSS
ncbi:MAG: CHAT domain-containing protein, partial [Bacteroidota bacterium]